MDTKDTNTSTYGYGKINLSRSSATVAAMRVKPPFLRESAANTGKRDVRTATSVNATTQPTVGGGFSRMQVAHPDGTIIMLMATETRRGAVYSQGALFLRLRNTGPMIVVAAKLPVGEESLLGDTFNAFVGRADVMTYQELRTLGIEIPARWRAMYMEPEEVDERFTVELVGPAMTDKPTLMAVATANGVEVKAVATETQRRIRIRR